MAAPSRFTSGVTQAAGYQPLGGIGIPDPFFYADFADDFLPYNAALYTVTAASGSVAATATNGAGGRALFTTGATAGNFAELQLPAASFQYTAGKKLAFMARIRINQATDAAMLGLTNTTATPFTGGSVTDGIYFNIAASSNIITLTAVTGGTVVGTAPTVATYTVGQDIDLAFIVERSGSIKAWAGQNLEGFKRPNQALLGPMGGIQASALTGALSTAMLNPLLAVSNGVTASAATMVSDFLFAAMER